MARLINTGETKEDKILDTSLRPQMLDDYIELQQCEICNEWFPEEELIDTTEMINGGCGFCCEQCIENGDMKEL